jgi:hypothetical protein
MKPNRILVDDVFFLTQCQFFKYLESLDLSGINFVRPLVDILNTLLGKNNFPNLRRLSLVDFKQRVSFKEKVRISERPK